MRFAQLTTTFCILQLVLWVVPDSVFAANGKIKIKSVRFEGNVAFEDKQLHRVMISRPSSLLNRSHYNEEVLKDDLKKLELYYQRNGYLQARVDDYQVRLDSLRREADIHITLSEGEPTTIEGVSVLGNSFFPDDSLRKRINIAAEDLLLRSRIEDANLALLTLYADNGFLDAEVKPEIHANEQTHRALVDFYINEKTQYLVEEIRLSELKKTRPKIVWRSLSFRKGEVVNYSKLLESQRKIYLTSLFQSVFIRPQPSAMGDSSKKDILVELKENMSGEFNVALGYGSIEKAIGRLEVYNNNLGGTARKLGFNAEMSFINRLLGVSFSEPWTFGTPWRTDINLTVEYKEEPGYNLDRAGGQITLGRKFDEHRNFTVTYRHEDVRLSELQVTETPGELSSNTRSFKFSIIYDTRDNLFNASRGTYAELSDEVGIFFADQNSLFNRLSGKYKYFYPLSDATTLATGLEVGWMDSRDGLTGIPLHERFYAGGPHSLRAFSYQKAGPLDRGRMPIGGRLKLVWNLVEFRRTLYKLVGGVLFVDVGNVWLGPGSFALDEIRTSLGCGLRLNTPIGLGRLDYGFNPERRPGEPRRKIYFSMGQAF